jgi:hypothetical protein
MDNAPKALKPSPKAAVQKPSPPPEKAAVRTEPRATTAPDSKAPPASKSPGGSASAKQSPRGEALVYGRGQSSSAFATASAARDAEAGKGQNVARRRLRDKKSSGQGADGAKPAVPATEASNLGQPGKA